MILPDEFISKMEKLFVDYDELVCFLDSLKQSRHVGIRANTLKISLEDFKKIFTNLEQTPWCKHGFYYLSSKPASKNPLYYAGLYYIQEPSAMSAASILDVQLGDKVLDLCASPGGKSTQIAQALAGSGLLVANDSSASRISRLTHNIEIMGIKNAIVLCDTPERLAQKYTGYFDKILVDAPCSGEGMFRKNSEAVSAWDKGKSARLAAIQREILHNAAKMLTCGGRLVYSTCTFSPTENEEVIEDFLVNNRDFELIPITHTEFGVSPANQGLTTKITHAARIWPHRQKGEGHFIALLEKTDGKNTKCTINDYFTPKFSNKYFDEFCEKHLLKPLNGKILSHKEKLFLLPEICPNTAGVRVSRLGLYLGSLKKQRFEPSFALAMSLTKSDFVNTIDLPADDLRVWRYLEGDSFEINANNGYNLFCVDGFSLGFAKILNGRLKWRTNGR